MGKASVNNPNATSIKIEILYHNWLCKCKKNSKQIQDEKHVYTDFENHFKTSVLEPNYKTQLLLIQLGKA